MLKAGDYVRNVDKGEGTIIIRIDKMPSSGTVIRDTFLDYEKGSYSNTWRRFTDSSVWVKIAYMNTPLYKVMNE